MKGTNNVEFMRQSTCVFCFSFMLQYSIGDTFANIERFAVGSVEYVDVEGFRKSQNFSNGTDSRQKF